jgi:uncharacterized protein YdcH (DUF465 family)
VRCSAGPWGVVVSPEALFSIEGNRVVPVALREVDGFTAVSPAVREFTVYAGLRVEGGVVKAARWPSVDAAPVGSLALFSYTVESGGRVLHRYRRWFVVVDGVERTVVLRDRRGAVDVRVRVVNLLPLPDIDVSMVPEIISRIAGRGLKPSESDPVLALYAYWVVLGVHERPFAVAEPGEVAGFTAVKRYSERGLVKLYFLGMRLPSPYLVQEYKSEGYVEKRIWGDKVRRELKRRLEAIRRACYDRIRRVFAAVEEYGVWIAVTDAAVREAERISRWVLSRLSRLPLKEVKDVDLSRYSVKAIPVYLEPEHAREILELAERRLSADVEELRRRIEEAEREREEEKAWKLKNDLRQKLKLLEEVKAILRWIIAES